MRAEIIKVGEIQGEGADARPIGFEFDCKGSIPAMDIRDDGIYYGGYSIQEFAELSAQRP